MSDDISARLGLPLIHAGQAQKELSHNEALALLELLVQPVVQTLGMNDPPGTPLPGQAWIVGAAPTGDWLGHADRLAGWTAGGWRFLEPFEGMSAWALDSNVFLQFFDGAWTSGILRGDALALGGSTVAGHQLAAISDPTAGTVVDVEARASIVAILGALRGHGLIAV